MEDYLVRAVTRKGHVRGLACVTTQLVNDVNRKQETSPTAIAALGRALTGGALMGALLKTGQRVALKFEGNGPLRKILVEADSDGTVRGTVGTWSCGLSYCDQRSSAKGTLPRNSAALHQ